MTPERLNRRLEVYLLDKTATETGGSTGTWTLDRTIFANVEQLSGNKALQFSQVTDQKGFEIYVRYNPQYTFTKEMQFRVDGLILTPHDVEIIKQDRKWVRIIAFDNDND